MPRYRSEDSLPYFCTITVLDWIPVFIESRYIAPLVASLQFCRRQRGLHLFAYVVMPNHLHLIASAESGLNTIMRDFKRFTSRTIHELLAAEGRITLLTWLQRAGESARQARGEFSLWIPGFQPKVIYTREVFQQKLEYLHLNPVRKGLVASPEDWRFSSAAGFLGEADSDDLDPIEDWW